MQEVLQNQDFSKFHSLKPQLLETVDRMLAIDIARLMNMIPQEESELVTEPLIKGKLPLTSKFFNLILSFTNMFAYEFSIFFLYIISFYHTFILIFFFRRSF
jgi:Domain of unknown function (DUF5600)